MLAGARAVRVTCAFCDARHIAAAASGAPRAVDHVRSNTNQHQFVHAQREKPTLVCARRHRRCAETYCARIRAALYF